MIHINCPNCKHTRIVSEDKIPSTATMATCPKCKSRFSFRRLSPTEAELAAPTAPLTPTSTEDFNRKHADIWEAVDSLNKQWTQDTKTAPPQPEQTEPPRSCSQEEANNPRVAEAESAHLHENRKNPPAISSLPLFLQNEPKDADFMEEAEKVAQQAAQQAQEPASTENTHSGVETSLHAVQPIVEDTAHSSLRNNAPSTLGTPTPEDNPVEYNEQPAITPVFPYADSDIPPEERVERDLLLLQASDTRPVKDLGNLLELSLEEEADEDVAEVPWEYPEKNGWFLSFVATIKAVMFNSPLFFSSMPKTGALGFAFLFFLIQGYIAILCTTLWRQIAAITLDIPTIGARMDVLPMLLLLFPIIMGGLLALAAGLTRILLEIASKNRCNLPFACRLFSYAAAPLLVSLIPFVGPLASAVWLAITLVIACRYACSLSWACAFFTALPGASILLGGLFWFFV